METYRVLLLGDFHFGESYRNAGARVLKEHGYQHSTVHLRRFTNASDSVILNLETPLVDPVAAPSPFKGIKPYVHWGAPTATVDELQGLKVDAVSLANNHTLDHGAEGLESTFLALRDGGIQWFGAGRDLAEARAPYRLTLPERVGGGEIHFHGSFQHSTRYNREFAFYADEASSGCAPLSLGDVPAARSASTRRDSLQVAFPHWGANYAWRNESQYQLAHRFLRKDYDLVLGHGGHVLQEVHRKQQRWVLFGIGNGNFQSGGRWRKYEESNGILPFSLWTILEVQQHEGNRRIILKLYPVYSDNAFTNFQPGPVASGDFDRVVRALSAQPVRPWRFDNPARTTGFDDLGHFIKLDLGDWEEGNKPARLAASVEGGDPGEWPLRGPNTEVEDEVLRLNKGIAVAGLAIAARANGASVQWVAPRLALIEHGSKRMVATNYLVHESSLGASVSHDKVLVAELLKNAGVPTPRSVSVDSAEAAINAAITMPGPVVVKPRSGRMSKGVSTDLTSSDEIREAYAFARAQGTDVLVQEHIEVADELRVMASPDRVVAVNKRVLPHVVGDGTSTIKQLIADKNMQRSINPSLKGRSIPIDTLTRRELSRQGLSLDDVVALGRTVTVRNVAGVSVGADIFQALESTEAWIKEVATSAIAALPGLEWGGVDLIIEKNTGKPYVLEINTQAGYGTALFPSYGQPRDVFSEVWELRSQATASKVTSVPKTLEPRKRRAAFLARAARAPEGGITRFATLFESSLERQGYTIERRSRSVRWVTSPQAQSAWVTKDALTAEDRVVVHRVMQRHEWVSKLLDISGIPRTRSRLITSIRDLSSFVEGRVSQVFVMPRSAPWAGPRSNVLTAEEALALESQPERMWVQARGAGDRVRVLASVEEVWLITTEGKTRPLPNAAVAAAGRLGVEAVRAVPELRWAAVDILVRPQRLRKGRPGGVLVEGLTRRPVFSGEDQVIAGDFDEFVDWLLQNEVNRHQAAGHDRGREAVTAGSASRRPRIIDWLKGRAG